MLSTGACCCIWDQQAVVIITAVMAPGGVSTWLSAGDGGGPFLSDLVIMLTGVIFLFNLTAFSGKDEEDHLHRAQRSLAAMQSLVHPPQPAGAAASVGTPNSTDAAAGVPGGQDGGGGAAAVDACGAPTPAATFVRFCTATYAVCMGCMEDAAAILRQALRDAPMLDALAEANAPNGAGPGLAVCLIHACQPHWTPCTGGACERTNSD